MNGNKLKKGVISSKSKNHSGVVRPDKPLSDFESTSSNSPSTNERDKKHQENIIKKGKHKDGKKIKKVKFLKDFVTIEKVECWKKYNVENTKSDPYTEKKVYCKCNLF